MTDTNAKVAATDASTSHAERLFIDAQHELANKKARLTKRYRAIRALSGTWVGALPILLLGTDNPYMPLACAAGALLGGAIGYRTWRRNSPAVLTATANKS